MTQTRQTIELYMARNKLSERDAFMIAWKWDNNDNAPTRSDLKRILEDLKNYRGSPAGRRKKPDYVIRFEDHVTATYMPTLPDRTWAVINRQR